MADTAEMTALLIPPPKGWAVRTADVDGADLVIRSARRLLGPVTTERYGLTEIPPDRFGCRAFVLKKVDGGEYVTVVGGMPYCSCTAGEKGRKRGPCKHRLAIDALVKAGRIPEGPAR